MRSRLACADNAPDLFIANPFRPSVNYKHNHLTDSADSLPALLFAGGIKA